MNFTITPVPIEAAHAEAREAERPDEMEEELGTDELMADSA